MKFPSLHPALPISLLLVMSGNQWSPAQAQGTAADYERATTLSKGYSNAVFRNRVTPNWLAGNGSFWYRVATGPGRAEFVFVDAKRGVRRPAFDHQALAQALARETKSEIEAGQLPFRRIFPSSDGSVVRFRVGEKSWQTDVQGTLRRSNEPVPLERLQPTDAKTSTANGSVATALIFTNRTDEEVTLFWLDFEGKEQKYNTIARGATLQRDTFVGHLWRVKSASGKDLGAFRATAEDAEVWLGAPNAAPNAAPSAAPAAATARVSRSGGAPTYLVFNNRTAAPIRLFWIDTTGKEIPVEYVAAGATVRRETFVGHIWAVKAADGITSGVFEATTPAAASRIVADAGKIEQQPVSRPLRLGSARFGLARFGLAPSGFVRDFNIWLRGENGREIRLTQNGTADNFYRAPLQFSRDGRFLVASQVQPAQQRTLTLIESSPDDGVQPKVQTRNYLKPGDRVEIERPRLFDAIKNAEIATDDALFRNPWSIENLGWSEDGTRFRFSFNERGHQILRVLEMSTAGQVRSLVDERSETFIDYSQKNYSHLVAGREELIWASERDGWNHLYLYDLKTGDVKNQITRGNWVMREVVRVDENRRQIWFRALGLVPGQDPYYSQLARVNFDGSGLAVLTEGDGNHSTQFSPDQRFLVDTFSRVDLAPVTTLRDAQSGTLICELERSDLDALKAAKWSVPERFEALGRDGQTPIYGILVRPSNFDPARKYPIIEDIYAGPHGFFVPKSFDTLAGMHSMAELGFIVVKIDGMGTNWRSKAFHDVAWKNLKDAGFPDRITWMRAAAKTRPWMDLERVGIYGVSAGAQSALGALLFHGDFYDAAYSDCGCHDNRMDKIWWNEAWMGWPVGPQYADNSNVTHAAKLKGALFLTVGELDTNVDPASTLQVVNALIKAGKEFEFLMIPGAGHGAGVGEYGQKRQRDFFVRHLLGVQPPRRNSP